MTGPRIWPRKSGRRSICSTRCVAGPARGYWILAAATGGFWSMLTRRGARAVGITISPPQVAADRARGLDVRELNYRNIFAQSNPPLTPSLQGRGRFVGARVRCDCGERFAGAFRAGVRRRGGQGRRNLRGVVRDLPPAARRWRAIRDDGDSFTRSGPVRSGRNCPRAPRPSAWKRRISICNVGRHVRRLVPGARPTRTLREPYFELVAEEDGTHDYHLTSEYWLRQFRRSLMVQSTRVVDAGRTFLAATAGGMGDAPSTTRGSVLGVAIPPAGADAAVPPDLGSKVRGNRHELKAPFPFTDLRSRCCRRNHVASSWRRSAKNR